MKTLGVVLLATGIGAVAFGPRPASPNEMIVHEWGTITTVHAPNGTPRGGLNGVAQAESLPRFVHRFDPQEMHRDTSGTLLKTIPGAGRFDVTMRLETPVIYFYPPRGDSIAPFNVRVNFRGGVLNEFYPNAVASVQLDDDRPWDGRALTSRVVGGLRWDGTKVKDVVPIQTTASHVWLSPRAVHATGVVTPAGEGERYLFYRGVAHLDALVRTVGTETGVTISSPSSLDWMRSASVTIPGLWLADIRSDGRAAFREHAPVVLASAQTSRELARMPWFTAPDYTATGIAGLRASMHRALIGAGLFEDEADAMLETWKASYFGKPGYRIFYVVPPEWTNHFLPLNISAPHKLTRVLIGRIDLPDR